MFSRTTAPLILVLLIAGAATACAQEAQPADRGTTAAGPDAVVGTADASRSKGAEDAPVQIVEISDFQCGFCRRFAEETMPAVDSAYIQTGQVRFLYVHYPLPNHQQSWAASKASLCAGAQDAFWPMHDLIFAGQSEWAGDPQPVDRFRAYADEAGVDRGAFDTCMENDQVASVIVNDLMQVSRAGVTGTPTFIINNETVVQGHLSFEEFSQHIDAALAGNGAAEGGDEPEE